MCDPAMAKQRIVWNSHLKTNCIKIRNGSANPIKGILKRRIRSEEEPMAIATKA